MKLINVFYATAGGGHKSAAIALRECLIEKGRACSMIDLLDFSNRLFKWTYSSGYEFISEHAQTALKGMYHITDQNRTSSNLIHMVDSLSLINIPGFEHYITDNPDMVAICTHFFPSTVLSSLKAEGKYRGRLYVCITDYGFHKMWFAEEIDRYFVANTTIKDSLLDLGVRADKIILSGIPIRKNFSQPRDKTQTQFYKDLEEDKFTLLFVTTAIPDSEVLEIINKFLVLQPEINLLIVSGRNKSIQDKMTAIKSRGNVTIFKYGFVNNMDELMDVSQLMLTKPGGLITSEALALGVPVLMYRPIPYQETKNAEYIEKSGAGLLAFSEEDVLRKINDLYSHPLKLKIMAQNGRKISFPEASETIVRKILEETSY